MGDTELFLSIFVPRGRDSFAQHQESRPLTFAIFEHAQSTRSVVFKNTDFWDFNNESVNRGLPVLGVARSRFLVLNKRIAASGGENDFWVISTESWYFRILLYASLLHRILRVISALINKIAAFLRYFLTRNEDKSLFSRK